MFFRKKKEPEVVTFTVVQSREEAEAVLELLAENGIKAVARDRESEESFLIGQVLGCDRAILRNFLLLQLLGEVIQNSEHGGIVQQILGAILEIAILEALEKGVKIQVDGITCHELTMSLHTEVCTDSVAIVILFRDQSSLTSASADAITSGEESSTKTDSNQFFHFLYPFCKSIRVPIR